MKSVVVFSAFQDVIAASAVKRVIARATVEIIVSSVTVEFVATRCTDLYPPFDFFDIPARAVGKFDPFDRASRSTIQTEVAGNTQTVVRSGQTNDEVVALTGQTNFVHRDARTQFNSVRVYT